MTKKELIKEIVGAILFGIGLLALAVLALCL